MWLPKFELFSRFLSILADCKSQANQLAWKMEDSTFDEKRRRKIPTKGGRVFGGPSQHDIITSVNLTWTLQIRFAYQGRYLAKARAAAAWCSRKSTISKLFSKFQNNFSLKGSSKNKNYCVFYYYLVLYILD